MNEIAPLLYISMDSVVGRGLAPAVPRLTDCGRIVEQQLLDLENRFKHIKDDKYVIMPDHVHVIFIVMPAAAGASPRPTVSDVICAWKSLSARRCKTEGKCQKLWQSSFYDHIIRDENDYLTRWNRLTGLLSPALPSPHQSALRLTASPKGKPKRNYVIK